MIKSPLRYPGGKSKALQYILPLIPHFKEFREPFVGGGSVFITLKQMFPDRSFWINDLYFELYNFWIQSQKNLYQVVEKVEEWKQRFRDGRELYVYLKEGMDNFSSIEKASAFFVINRITFSGTTEAGGFSNQAFLKRFTHSSIQRLLSIKSILSNNVKITNLDYEEVVKAPGSDVFIFLDPPYFSATKSALYGKNGALHKQFDHERFARVIKECPHRWLITYDNCQYIKDLFSFAHIVEWSFSYGMRNQTPQSNQLGKELFIANYDLSKVLKKRVFPNS